MEQGGGVGEVGEGEVGPGGLEGGEGVGACGDGECEAAVCVGAGDVVGGVADDDDIAGLEVVAVYGGVLCDGMLDECGAGGAIVSEGGDGEEGGVDVGGVEFDVGGGAVVAGDDAEAGVMGVVMMQVVEEGGDAGHEGDVVSEGEQFALEFEEVGIAEARVVDRGVGEIGEGHGVLVEEGIESSGGDDWVEGECGAEADLSGAGHSAHGGTVGEEEGSIDIEEEEFHAGIIGF